MVSDSAAMKMDNQRLQQIETLYHTATALQLFSLFALNHPNILVAELPEGEELRAQLDHGPLPVRKALEYAQQIAAGLAAAH